MRKGELKDSLTMAELKEAWAINYSNSKNWHIDLSQIFSHPNFNDKLERVKIIRHYFFDVVNQLNGRNQWKERWEMLSMRLPYMFRKMNMTPEERKLIIDTYLKDIKVLKDGKFNDSIISDFLNKKFLTNQEAIYVLKYCQQHNYNMSFVNFIGYLKEKDLEKSFNDLQEIFIGMDNSEYARYFSGVFQKTFAKHWRKLKFEDYHNYNNDGECPEQIRLYFDFLKNVYANYKQSFSTRTFLDKMNLFIAFGSSMSENEQVNSLTEITIKHKDAYKKIHNKLKWYSGEYKYNGYGFISMYPQTQDIYNSFAIAMKLSR